MIAKFNPTGTHVHKGFLKVRVDLYPVKDNATYSMHKIKNVINPCLCHFLIVNEDISLVDLEVKVAQIFDSVTVEALDGYLSTGNIAQVSQTMRTKRGSGAPVTSWTEAKKAEVDTRLSALEITV